MSLRRRVLLGCILTAVVLVVSDVVLARTFNSFLLGSVDRQLESAAAPMARRAASKGGLPRRNRAITEYYIAVVSAAGEVRTQVGPGLRAEEPPPALPAPVLKAQARGAGEPLHPFTVAATSGAGSYRAVAVALPNGDRVVMALTLREMLMTFHRMLLVVGLASLIVLATLVAVAVWVLRLGVGPLAAMAETAQVIAAGDLSQRVAHVEERTEAGRLGLAFNAMLEQIEEAFKQRAASEDRLRRFIADASHELRTPLTSIRGYAELWRQGGLRSKSELADAARRVEQEAARMGVLVDDLLLLARLDQGRRLERSPVDLSAIVTDAVHDARAVEPDRPITLRVEPVTVIGDDHRLRQVVANLLANARMHTPPATPVEVAVHSDGDRAVIEVVDHGPGLDPETASRVFERFYRADRARSRARGGSGLGLSIVAAVAEAHGGRAWVSSGPGEGARFVVELPGSPSAPVSVADRELLFEH